MANTCEQQDDGPLAAAGSVMELRLTDARDVPSDDVRGPGDDKHLRSPRRRSRISMRASAHAAIAFVTLIIIMLVAQALVGPAGELTLVQVLGSCLVLAGGFAVTIGPTLRRDGRSRLGKRRPTRIAVIGSQGSAVALDLELEINSISAYTWVGWIAAGTGQAPQFPLPHALGGMEDLASHVESHRIDLLLIGPDVPRLDVFDELVRLTDIVCVRAYELSAFYEDAFGHIPVAEINSAWFQYVMHPKFRPTRNRAKRVFDVGMSTLLGIAALPLLLVAALLIKLDGGTALYRQRRIGEKGRPFTMYKLRTMRERRGEDDAQTWCSVDDPRVTRAGHVLRRMHIDELPQLYNVLRGEMSIVGPRPEQPDIVSRLETEIAFYSRRHLIRPGLAGWAQLRCGYARSMRGSAWKLCHDLYYLKHQSLKFDMVILVRTFLTLARRAATHDPRDTRFTSEPLNAVAGYEPAALAGRE